MTRRADRPEPLQRLVRRSDRRCVVAAGWFAAFVALDVTTAIDEDRLFDGATAAEAVVATTYDPGSGDLTVPLQIGERRVETRPVYDAPLPRPGEAVQVEVAAGQPAIVRLTGTSYPLHVDRLFQIAPFVVCLALAAGRRRFVRQVLRRAGSEERAFELVGILRAARGSRRLCLLDLYALDAGVDERPVTTVPLATTAGLPLGVPLTVAAKGVPRAFSLVVCRSELGVLWPSAPALGARRRSPGRLAGTATVTPLPATDAPPPLSVRSVWRRPGLVAFGGSLLVLLLVVAIVGSGVARDERRERSWPRARATVVDGTGSDCAVDVTYEAAAGARSDSVPVGDCGDVPEGDGYVVLVDPADPDHALLLSELYDPWLPLGFAVLVVVTGAWWASQDVRRYRRVREAVAGPWWTAAIEHDDESVAIRGPDDAREAARAWVRPEGALTAAGTSGPKAVAVAGDVEPGGTLVTWRPGDQLADEHQGRNGPASGSWWRP